MVFVDNNLLQIIMRFKVCDLFLQLVRNGFNYSIIGFNYPFATFCEKQLSIIYSS